ncbi:MAG: PhoPQ-activated pathogenicity-related family protein, partial [Cyclobacteriaceae bacterium]|nr:PhoPQ-activated pathogenicity-related family protein [Cyclobacteriaceae bacterium]
MNCPKFTISLLLLIFVTFSCKQGQDTADTTAPADSTKTGTLLDQYVNKPDTTFKYELRDSVVGDGYVTYFLYMESQRWMTENEVKNPLWWHWLTVTVPDEVVSETGLLWIGGGSRTNELPKEPWRPLVDLALYTKTVTAGLHNIPNQKTEFVGDDYGPRVEDELIAYGWRKFLEGGAKDEDALWLARLPMTKAAVRAMDAVSGFCKESLKKEVSKYTVFGGSKRGWTTWTTAAVDKRVVAIAPIVIDMLNVVPSFQHHWQAYGFWAPAVGNYVHEGIMDWQETEEYQKLISITEPYSYRERLTMPKFII